MRETPPDLKAYSEASRIGDPQEKIEALEKFMHDFPHSARVRSADYSILLTLMKRFPGQVVRIRSLAKRVTARRMRRTRALWRRRLPTDFWMGACC